MTNSTLSLAPVLAHNIVEAFDGDDVHAKRVRSLADVLAISPLSTREMMAWVKVTTGTELSQKTVDRAQGVAMALVKAEYDFTGDDGMVSSTVANLVRIRTASPKHGGGSQAVTDLTATYAGDIVAFTTVVADYWDYVTDQRSAPALVTEAVSQDDSTEDDTDDTGAGEPDDGAVGGGESSIMSAEKSAAVMREIAGNISAGRIAPTDDLIAAAMAILDAASAALDTVNTVTATSNTGALALA